MLRLKDDLFTFMNFDTNSRPEKRKAKVWASSAAQQVWQKEEKGTRYQRQVTYGVPYYQM